MDRTLEVRSRAQRVAGRGVRRAALRSHARRLHQPDHGGWVAARRDSRAARARIRVRAESTSVSEISRSYPAVPVRSRVEAVRQGMIRALTGMLAGAICLMLAGCGAEGEAYQPRSTPAAQ